MAGKRRRFTPEFKARVALEALRERDSVQAIARRHELHPNQVSTWKRQLLEGLPEVFAGGAGRKLAKEHEAKVRDLHAKIGELTVERDFFGNYIQSLMLPRPTVHGCVALINLVYPRLVNVIKRPCILENRANGFRTDRGGILVFRVEQRVKVDQVYALRVDAPTPVVHLLGNR